MPTAVGPNTKGEENLVFGYDLGDVSNSYKGEPTTNVVNYPQPTTGWGIANYNSTSTRSYGFDENGEPVLIIDVTVAGSGYPRSTGAYLSSNITGTFSTSFEARSDTDGTNIALKIYENGSTKVTNTANLTTQWQRFTFDNQSTGFSLNQPYFNPVNVGRYYIRKIQIEAKSHSTPFVNGTRSATQGLIDLKGNSTIDLTNVSFDSNAQPAWDATNDYVSRSSVIQYSTTQPWTVELVMNPGSNDAPLYWNALFGYSLSYGGYWMFHSGNGTLTWYEYPSQLLYTSINLGDEIPWNSNTHLAFVYNGASNYKIYVNNVLSFDSNRTFYANYSGGFRYIGGVVSESRYGRNYIPYFKNYNRALTASEVASNYKAIKGRFNI